MGWHGGGGGIGFADPVVGFVNVLLLRKKGKEKKGKEKSERKKNDQIDRGEII